MISEYNIPHRISIYIVFFSNLFSLLLITPIYNQVPVVSASYIPLYKSLGADLPLITNIVLKMYQASYVFSIAVALFSVLFYFKNKANFIKGIYFLLLNVAVIFCFVWSMFVDYALQLPLEQLAAMK